MASIFDTQFSPAAESATPAGFLHQGGNLVPTSAVKGADQFSGWLWGHQNQIKPNIWQPIGAPATGPTWGETGPFWQGYGNGAGEIPKPPAKIQPIGPTPAQPGNAIGSMSGWLQSKLALLRGLGR